MMSDVDFRNLERDHDDFLADEAGEASVVNDDLIGKMLHLEIGEYTVTGSEPWSDQYVELEADGKIPICRPAGLIRRHLELQED